MGVFPRNLGVGLRVQGLKSRSLGFGVWHCFHGASRPVQLD